MLKDYLKTKKINPAKMTAAQANEFVNLVKTSKCPAIANFLENISARIAGKIAPKVMGGLARKAGPWVIGGIFVYDAVTAGPAEAANNALWPISEAWTGPFPPEPDPLTPTWESIGAGTNQPF